MTKKQISIIMGMVLVMGLIGSLMTNEKGGISTHVNENIVINKLDTAEINAVNIEANIGQVLVRPTEDEEIIVTLEGIKTGNRGYSLQTDMDDSTLIINLEQSQQTVISVPFFSESLTLILTVYLPDKQYETLIINHDIGEISVEQIQVKELDVDVNMGSIDVDQTISETIYLTNDVGDIVVNQLVGDLEAKVDMGSIYVDQTTSETIHLTSNVGDIVVNQLVGDLEAKVDMGSIYVDQTTSENIHLTSDVGDIVVNELVGDLEAKVNMGEVDLITDNIDQNIEIQVDIGSILVELKTEPEDVLISSSTDMGSSNLFGEASSAKLFGNGKNLVNLSSNMGDVTVQLK